MSLVVRRGNLGAGPTQGFFGKIPARGDFVRSGLPRAFIEPWDRWLELVLAGSRERLGDAWRPAWLEAAVWRFALAPGMAGPMAAYGVLLPSVDSHGRYFPLTVACVGETAIDPEFFSAAETVGCAAVTDDLAPDELAARLAGPRSDDIDQSAGNAADSRARHALVDRRSAASFAADACPGRPAGHGDVQCDA